MSMSIKAAFARALPEPMLRLIGLLSLAAHVLLYLTVPDIGSAALGVLIIASALLIALHVDKAQLRDGIRFVKIPLLLFLAALLIQVISWIGSLDLEKQYVEDIPKLDRLARWFVFIVVLFWLCEHSARIFAFWSLSLAGCLIAPWITGNGLDEFILGLQGERVDFGIRNAQHTGMLFGIGLLGLCIFYRRIVHGGPRTFLRLTLWLIPFLICLLGTIITQTRGVWIALAVALVLGIVSLFSLMLSGRMSLIKSHASKSRGIALSITLITATAILAVSSERAMNRLELEMNTVKKAWSEGVGSIPFNSAGVRLHTWSSAGDWIEQKPLFGWGKLGSIMLIQESETLPPRIKRRYGHLHSTYLDMLVQHGSVGLLLMFLLYGWVIHKVVQAWRTGRANTDILIFTMAFFSYWLIANLFESFMLYSTGRFAFNIVVAGLLAVVYQRASSPQRST